MKNKSENNLKSTNENEDLNNIMGSTNENKDLNSIMGSTNENEDLNSITGSTNENKDLNNIMYNAKAKNLSNRNKIMCKRVKKIIEYIIIMFVIFVNGILFYQSISNPSKAPSLFGRKAFVIISESMIPEIHIGDIVIMKDTTDAGIGDIIAFRRNSNVVVHRIIKKVNFKGNVMYRTKGDNNNVEDKELVDVSAIEGVYVAKIPFIGKILIWLYDNMVIVVAVIIIWTVIKILGRLETTLKKCY